MRHLVTFAVFLSLGITLSIMFIWLAVDRMHNISEPYKPYTDECEEALRSLIGTRLIATVDSKIFPPQHGSVLPSCRFNFPDSKIDFELYSICNTYPGFDVGQNKNYLYGELAVKGSYKKELIDRKGNIQKSDQLKFTVTIPDVEKYYPDNVTIENSIYHKIEVQNFTIDIDTCSINTTANEEIRIALS